MDAKTTPRLADWQDASRRAMRVMVLQGGGALGAYQAGVYEALERQSLQPHWVAGISIGAINAALIAGNAPERRVERLREFWEQASSAPTPTPLLPGEAARRLSNDMSAAIAATFGVPGMFEPRFLNPWLAASGTPNALSVYDTAPLKATLERLVDFDRINGGETRLTVGADNVLTGNSVIFDNIQRKIGPEHIMASGALPPGLPPVIIDDEPYWDGGLVSNTPLEFVLDEAGNDDVLIFQLDLFNARGPMPRTLLDVDERTKDIRYSSRTRMNTDMNMRIHKAKAAMRSLLASLPGDFDDREDVACLREMARENAVTVVQLIYRKRPYEGGSKDYEFSRQTMLEHWASGLADADRCALHKDRLQQRIGQGGVVVIDPGLRG